MRKFPSGLVEIYAEISGGKISGIKIMGDYFFESPTVELETVLTGCLYDNEAVLSVLKRAGLAKYIAGVSPEDLAGMMF